MLSLAEKYGDIHGEGGFVNRFDSVLRFATLAREEAKKINYKKGLGNALLTAAGVEIIYSSKKKTNFSVAENYLLQVVHIGEQLNDNKMLGGAYLQMSKIKNAIENQKKAYEYFVKVGDMEQKVSKKINHPITQQLEILLQRINQPCIRLPRIALPTMQGLEFVPVESIISCSSSNNYTDLFLKDKKRLLVSRTLKETEDMLADHAFLRVHNSHVVNLNAITRYVKGEGGYLVMSDGTTVDVSRSKKEILLKKLLPG